MGSSSKKEEDEDPVMRKRYVEKFSNEYRQKNDSISEAKALAEKQMNELKGQIEGKCIVQ